MAKDINSLEDAIRAHNWLSDGELARIEVEPSATDAARLLREYKLCRALLREALTKQSRLAQLQAGSNQDEVKKDE